MSVAEVARLVDAAAGESRAGARTSVGFVVIGRNEGERLKRCLRSVIKEAEKISAAAGDEGERLENERTAAPPAPGQTAARRAAVVYVDSASRDDSVTFAGGVGVEVVQLDATRPYTAARSRNAGLQRLLQVAPATEYVQFVDGDCELIDGWISEGLAVLHERPEVAAVAGRVIERHPERSIYNRLCQLEWDGPRGAVAACGGIALMRVAAVRAAGGFDETLIAGEEPELCYRMRQRGGKIVRLATEMTYHDAAILRFGQWRRRAVRAGFTFAEGAWRYGRGPERYNVRRTLSALAWGLFLPLVILALAWSLPYFTLAVTALYPLLWGRMLWRETRSGRSKRDAALFATFTLAGKFAQTAGILRFLRARLVRRPAGLIEYK